MIHEPVYRRLVPWVVAPLGARLGHPLWTAARRLAERQWDTPQILQTRAEARLRPLLEHAARHVPHYRDLFARAGLDPRDIGSIAELAKLPITSKAELRSGFPARTTADNIPTSRRQRMMTSGSTGLPLECYWDRSTLPLLAATELLWLEWAHTAIWHTRIVIASPAHFYNSLTPARHVRGLISALVLGKRSVTLPADELTTARFQAVVERVGSRGPYFLRGYPRAIAGLAAALSEEGTRLPSNPRVVVTLAETATAANIETMERVFGCRVVSWYSAWELPQIAHSCPDNPEVLHVNAERLIVRVVRPDGSDAAPGEPGRVVATDLANYVMPLINYFAGDRAVAGTRCPCGRGLPTLARLEGRESEVIRTPQGREVSAGALGQLLTFVVGIIPYVWEYQAIQTAPDALSLRVVPTRQFTSDFASRLRRELESFLGIAVSIEPVDHIALEPSGKRLIIKSSDTLT